VDLAVIHNIHDPEEWKRALAVDQEFPSGFTIRSFVEAADGNRALCLWDAPSQAELQEQLDRTFGQAAVNDAKSASSRAPRPSKSIL